MMCLPLACALLMACPAPVQNIPPPTPVGVEFALNAAITAEGKARERCPKSGAARAAITAARFTFNMRYGPYLSEDQRKRLEEARSDTDRCGDP
jgi:rRNA maturation protein Nop10